MSTLNIGFTRKVEVSMEVFDVKPGISTDALMEGLTTGLYEVMEGSGEILDCSSSEVVAKFKEFEEHDLTHGNFEYFE